MKIKIISTPKNEARNASHWHQDGGYIAGQTYDMSQEEFDRLQKLGYKLEVI